jgi:lysophospholipase L1-like esterase
MKLFTYGDSWTEGVGSDLIKEHLIDDEEERKKFRNDRSWPSKLSSLLQIEHQNQSISGVDNNSIFNNVIDNIKSGLIKSGDLIIIMWSSSLRDNVPFFPTNEWHTWGSNYLNPIHKKKWFIWRHLTKNSTYNDFLINFKEFFIDELFTQDYYNIVNQNYILFIQKLCEYYHVNYIFCDAFDKMVTNVKPENDKTNHINKTPYWGFGDKTFKDLLISTNDRNVWEAPQIDIMKAPGAHPSELGYKIIAEELFNFIGKNKSDIIRFTEQKKIKIF